MLSASACKTLTTSFQTFANSQLIGGNILIIRRAISFPVLARIQLHDLKFPEDRASLRRVATRFVHCVARANNRFDRETLTDFAQVLM